MNVIVICLDTLRWDHLGCYGNERVKTPAIDVFAREATRFDAAWCASFPTIPMRTDAFTGNVKWPVYGWKPLGEDEITVVQCLKDAGYHTAFVHDTSNMVSTGFGRDFDEDIFIQPPQGWQSNLDQVKSPVPLKHVRQEGRGFLRDRARTMHYAHETDWAVAQTMLSAGRWLEDNRTREKFFLWVDTFEIHEDWRAPDHYTEYYSPKYKGLDYSYPNYGYTDIYEKHELRRLQARYAAEVTLTDRWVGHLLRSIEIMGLLGNTMVVIISDHGMYLGEHGRTGKHSVDPDDAWPIYDEVGRIPLLIHVPGGKSPKRCGALVQPADLMPTILHACRAKGPNMYGKSLLPLLKGRARTHAQYVFTSCHSGTGPGRIQYLPSCITVTSARWTLVTGPQGWRPALHDRREDPGQKRNVIKRHPHIASDMQRALVHFMRDTGAEDAYIQAFTAI